MTEWILAQATEDKSIVWRHESFSVPELTSPIDILWVLNPLNGLIDQHSSDLPDYQDRHKGPKGLSPVVPGMLTEGSCQCTASTLTVTRAKHHTLHTVQVVGKLDVFTLTIIGMIMHCDDHVPSQFWIMQWQTSDLIWNPPLMLTVWFGCQ